MDLFNLVGTIAINNTDANNAIDDTTDKAEKSHGKMSEVFGKIGGVAVKAGKAIAVGIGAGATALIKSSGFCVPIGSVTVTVSSLTLKYVSINSRCTFQAKSSVKDLTNIK